jgi:hypothetical protein
LTFKIIFSVTFPIIFDRYVSNQQSLLFWKKFFICLGLFVESLYRLLNPLRFQSARKPKVNKIYNSHFGFGNNLFFVCFGFFTLMSNETFRKYLFITFVKKKSIWNHNVHRSIKSIWQTNKQERGIKFLSSPSSFLISNVRPNHTNKCAVRVYTKKTPTTVLHVLMNP